MRLKAAPALYILRQLENLNTYEDDSFRAQATLEHIFPQKATTDQWPQADRLKPYLWHIGNLTLLTKADNAKASNRKYTYKKSHVYQSALLNLTSGITEYRQWGVNPILRRAADLAKLANRRWNLD